MRATTGGDPADGCDLAGSVTDDGLPTPPGLVTAAWSKVSGPGTVAFADATAASTTATFSAAGSYVLRLTGDDGALTVSDDVTVTVSDPAPPPARCWTSPCGPAPTTPRNAPRPVRSP